MICPECGRGSEAPHALGCESGRLREASRNFSLLSMMEKYARETEERDAVAVLSSEENDNG